ncbi:mavicyanin [Manihot esculenta]|uniref:Phytocyanin domain-containing protein n=1 Tax=Manihot esculenta TaxID=3983 RepID=A0A2C9UG43_MANES|nr:mavicyanin [Manihot esculenta]OAY29408.1 hypothetical protein MANES_15G142900v8 [Manihot esculenta]
MGLTHTHLLIFLLIVCASVFRDGVSATGVSSSSCTSTPRSPRRITVGGSARWTFGFNYSTWAFNRNPFYVNDTLVFNYEPPSEKNIHPHSVYLLPDLESFVNCNLTNGVKIANETQGTGKGFRFVLKKWKPYYFSCGASDGYHCRFGGMKFFVLPLRRRNY